jgi:hypothetical protein
MKPAVATKMCDVAHDYRIETIELLRRNAVQGLDPELESASRERPKEERDRVDDERESPLAP